QESRYLCLRDVRKPEVGKPTSKAVVDRTQVVGVSLRECHVSRKCFTPCDLEHFIRSIGRQYPAGRTCKALCPIACAAGDLEHIPPGQRSTHRSGERLQFSLARGFLPPVYALVFQRTAVIVVLHFPIALVV